MNWPLIIVSFLLGSAVVVCVGVVRAYREERRLRLEVQKGTDQLVKQARLRGLNLPDPPWIEDPEAWR